LEGNALSNAYTEKNRELALKGKRKEDEGKRTQKPFGDEQRGPFDEGFSKQRLREAAEDNFGKKTESFKSKLLRRRKRDIYEGGG